MCGKTGTVQNPHGNNHAVFFAFAPRENPKIAIAVFVENAGYGGVVAGPIASMIVEKYLRDTVTLPQYLQDRIFNTDYLQRRSPAGVNPTGDGTTDETNTAEEEEEEILFVHHSALPPRYGYQ